MPAALWLRRYLTDPGRGTAPVRRAAAGARLIAPLLGLGALLTALDQSPARAQPPSAAPATTTTGAAPALDQMVQRNRDPFIPAQCYAQTVDANGSAHNPCYTCHVGSRAPNYIDDGALQLGYDFVPRARTNPWTNLFIDWSSPASREERGELLRYIRESNYFDASGQVRLQRVLAHPPQEWDFEDDGRWSGFVPDVTYRIDSDGYDRLADGGYSGWRSYAYYPLPGAFLPTNGSLGDAFIRLPEAFRQDATGKLEASVYSLNLAVVETLIRQQDVAIAATAERPLGVDLDLDGRLATASVVRFRAPGPGRATMSYVGRARQEHAAGRLQLAPGLFPEGTEFLHTLRYLDPTPQGVRPSARLKELRYARKASFWHAQRLDARAQQEAEEKADSPAEARSLAGNVERGVSNGQGWWLQGFIEDATGELRPQSFEETAFCVGCHGGVGRTDDSIFSFGRRLGFSTWRHGWYHPSQRGLEHIPDPPGHAGTSSEYVTYLEENGAADDFRQNEEAYAKFFDAQGRLRPELRTRLQRDISELLLPSAARAQALNAAYRALVRSQSFAAGRDVVIGGARNAHRRVPAGEKTGVARAIAHGAAGRRYVSAAKDQN